MHLKEEGKVEALAPSSRGASDARGRDSLTLAPFWGERRGWEQIKVQTTERIDAPFHVLC